MENVCTFRISASRRLYIYVGFEVGGKTTYFIIYWNYIIL
jgi:hypothetical protein